MRSSPTPARLGSSAGAPGPVVSEGPYAEVAEQFTGFYLVESDGLDDLPQVCGILAGADGVVEVRATAVIRHFFPPPPPPKKKTSGDAST